MLEKILLIFYFPVAPRCRAEKDIEKEDIHNQWGFEEDGVTTGLLLGQYIDC